MKRKIEVGGHYWYKRHDEQSPRNMIKVEEIIAGGKELVIFGLILNCDSLVVERKKDLLEENVVSPVSEKVLTDYKEKMQRVIANFFQ